MRTADGLQTTITCRAVNVIDQTFSVELSLEMPLPMPLRDGHLPDRIETHVHQAGLELQRRLFQVLIEKADHELVLQQRHGKAGAGIPRRGSEFNRLRAESRPRPDQDENDCNGDRRNQPSDSQSEP